MKFIADLHVHSKFSIATAKNLDLENLYIAARKKGIAVVGTGDFTHPGWRAEIREKLILSESGLYRLKKEIEQECDQQVPASCCREVRFILSSEISNIYKKAGKTRKNHNLIFVPDFDTADRFSDKLDRIGNINSDGRPILGLDARDMLEILLETSETAMFVPAHIWTPWFSLLGSKSGFDSVEECFEDLSEYIYAVETGLSSDPAMNWRVSNLDRMTLISNSDAHSPMKLGREANVFDTERAYDAILSAIKSGNPDQFKGTLEFFPEEGKYHLDGHRKCRVRCTPAETMANKGICPVCGKQLTVGVLYRVEELADRTDGQRPGNTHPYRSIVSLAEILSRILSVGVNSKKVQKAYHQTISALGDEFSILLHLPIEEIKKNKSLPLLGEAIRRMRKKEIKVIGGYDGEFGTIQFFDDNEQRRLSGQKALFDGEDTINIELKRKWVGFSTEKKDRAEKSGKIGERKDRAVANPGLNPAQRQAVEHGDTPLVISAGPGTGKTMTVTRRMARLIQEKKVNPHRILAVTFTNKAAEEMRTRLKSQLTFPENLPMVATFHALCLDLLKQQSPGTLPRVIDENSRRLLIKDAIQIVSDKKGTPPLKPHVVDQMIMTAKQKITGVDDMVTGQGEEIDQWVSAVYRAYQKIMKILEVCDFEDLIFKVVENLAPPSGTQTHGPPRFKYVFVDEYQDINEGQYRLVRALVPENGTGLCVIGDPDQSIYGFRGSDVRFFERFIQDFPGATRVCLNRNYRSVETILKLSAQVIRPEQPDADHNARRVYSGREGIRRVEIHTCRTERDEAATIGRRIVHLIGGRGYHDLDLGRMENNTEAGGYGFEDIAVLYRTRLQGDILADVFQKTGIPYQVVQRRYLFDKVRQLVSLLTITEGRPLYGDVETVRSLFTDAPTVETLKIFKKWGLTRKFTPWQALNQARIQAISTMSRARQRRLDQMIRQLKTLQSELEGLDVHRKLTLLIEKFNLSAPGKDEPDQGRAISELVQKAKAYGDQTAAFLSGLALETDTDAYCEKARTVSLMSMHAAKGLEFPVVFIAGCEDGLIPFHRSEDEAGDVGEERRLFYVAITRAKEELFFTRAKTRSRYGKRVKQQASPFVRTIEAGLLDQHNGIPKKRRYIQRSLFTG
ncbi:MAG: DNA helicase [Deltaproteobacteria bacterium]|nr:MAG: DNA helicase [Deltaproteobacteria bacterium]